jgi:hypothetical protein
MRSAAKATFTWLGSARPALVGPVDKGLPTLFFSPFQRAFVTIGHPARGLGIGVTAGPSFSEQRPMAGKDGRPTGQHRSVLLHISRADAETPDVAKNGDTAS